MSSSRFTPDYRAVHRHASGQRPEKEVVIMSRHNVYRSSVIVMLVGLLAAFGVQTTAALPSTQTPASVPLTSAGPMIDLKPCELAGGVRAECGTLRVFEN